MIEGMDGIWIASVLFLPVMWFACFKKKLSKGKIIALSIATIVIGSYAFAIYYNVYVNLVYWLGTITLVACLGVLMVGF